MKKILTLLSLILAISINLNAQKSQNMTLLASWDNDSIPTHNFGTFNDLWGYAANGREYIFMGSASYIHVFDVTDPTNLVEIDAIEGGSSTVWRDFKTYQDRAYCVSDNSGEGLIILDLSTLPDSVSVSAQHTDVFGSAHNCFIDEAHGRLYACGGHSDMIVFDLTQDLDNPVHLGNVSLPGGGDVHDLYVRDNIAYCSSAYEGMYIWDFTDAVAPVLVANLETNGYNHSSWVSDDGTYMIFAEEVPRGLPLGSMDLTNMMSNNIEVNTYFQEMLIEVVDSSALRNTPHNPYLVGDLAYVSYYEDGVHIYDFSDPDAPELVAYYDTYVDNELTNTYNGYAGCWGVYPYLPSGNLFASDMTYGLLSLQVGLSSAQENLSAVGKLKVFPNPSDSHITIQLEIENKANIEYSLHDLAGQTLLSGKFQAQDKHTENINIAHLSNGMYFLALKNDGEVYTQKIVKQ